MNATALAESAGELLRVAALVKDTQPTWAGHLRYVAEAAIASLTVPEERSRDAEFMAWLRSHAPSQLAELILKREQMRSQTGSDRSQPQPETGK